MKPGQYILLFCTVGLCVACVKNPNGNKTPSSVNIPAIESLTDFEVPTRAGSLTLVILGEDTLAATRIPMSISVPSYAKESGLIEVKYTDEDIYRNFANATYWQYLSFEDTRQGDYDYNDVVLHCRILSKTPYGSDKTTHTVSVRPVALGGSKSLKLGILYKESETAANLSEKILCQNIRTELFLGNPTFPINTDPNKEIKPINEQFSHLLQITNTDPNFKVVWFIETDSYRLYAATTYFGADKTFDMISPDGLPYGISLTNKWGYPKEKCPIREAYPNFDKWIKTGDETVLLQNSNSKNTFPATHYKAADGTFKNLWDYDKKQPLP